MVRFGDYAFKFRFGKRRQAVAASKFNTQKYKIAALKSLKFTLLGFG